MKRLRITVNGTPYEVDVEVLEDTDRQTKGYGFPKPSRPVSAPTPSVEPAPANAEISRGIQRPPSGNEKELTSPIAGTIIEIKIKPGDQVAENDPLMIIEAMKMNTHISSPVSGKIQTIQVKEKDGVTQGQVLVTFA